MGVGWGESYLGRLRRAVGTRKLIVNSIRAIVLNGEGQALFIRRRGDKKWGMPAGAMELDESIYEAMKREVKEETGLDVLRARLIAIYSSPDTQTYTDRWGNEHHVIEYLFWVEEWTGELSRVTDESVDAAFFSLDRLPEASNEHFSNHHKRVFHDFQNFRGELLLR